jgi:hypothetical protein
LLLGVSFFIPSAPFPPKARGRRGFDPERYLAEAMRRLSPDTTPEQAAELTPAKLAPLIRQLQPRPASADKPCAEEFASAA